MGTDQTPALARATEALHPYWAERYPSGSQADDMAKDAVSAALHDPDDDAIARTLGVHRLIGGKCRCGFNPRLDYFRYEQHLADAVRAAILGGDA